MWPLWPSFTEYLWAANIVLLRTRQLGHQEESIEKCSIFFFSKNNSPRVVYVFLHRCRYTPARTFSPRPFSVRSEAEPLTVAGDWGGSLLVAATVMKVLIGVYGFSLSSPPDQLKQNLKKNSTFRKTHQSEKIHQSEKFYQLRKIHYWGLVPKVLSICHKLMLPYGRCDHCDHRLPSTCEQLTLYCCELGNSVTKKKALRSALFFFSKK